MINHKHLRKIIHKKIDNYIYKKIVAEDDEDLQKVKLRRYQFLSAMLNCVVKNIDKGYVSADIIKKIVDVLVQNNFIRENSEYARAAEGFVEQYDEQPPSFIVLSPTQVCNLHCIGCYANSAANKPATIPYSYVDKIMTEIHDKWGCRFVTISGGEPFMYRSEGKTLLDVLERYNDMFFLVYTNGTLIKKDVCQKLADISNVTPAISVEGFEKETDQRRGAGTFDKILTAFENLREVCRPAAVSPQKWSINLSVLQKPTLQGSVPALFQPNRTMKSASIYGIKEMNTAQLQEGPGDAAGSTPSLYLMPLPSVPSMPSP